MSVIHRILLPKRVFKNKAKHFLNGGTDPPCFARKKSCEDKIDWNYRIKQIDDFSHEPLLYGLSHFFAQKCLPPSVLSWKPFAKNYEEALWNKKTKVQKNVSKCLIGRTCSLLCWLVIKKGDTQYHCSCTRFPLLH